MHAQPGATALFDLADCVDEMAAGARAPTNLEIDEIRELNALYGEACSAANARLKEVCRLLQRGLRNEALQAAERPTQLLDDVALLDFPELPIWREILSIWGVAQPPELAVDLAAEVNRAYAESARLAPLLRIHRLAALGRGPLDARLHVLRRIRAADPDNPIWQIDQAALERARLLQIADAAQRADQAGMPGLLRKLQAELTLSHWEVAAVEEVRAQIQAALDRHEAIGRQSQLEEVQTALQAACDAGRWDDALQLRQAWRAAVEAAQLEAHSPLLHAAQPALEALEQYEQSLALREKRRQELALLERAVDQATSAEALERKLRVTLCGGAVPPALQQAVVRRSDELRRRAQRRRWLVIGAVVSGFVAIVAAGGYAVLTSGRNEELARTRDELAQLLKRGDFAGAEARYAQLQAEAPAWLDWPAWQAFELQLRPQLAQAADRGAALTAQLAQAEADFAAGQAVVDLLPALWKQAETEPQRLQLLDFERRLVAAGQLRGDRRRLAEDALVALRGRLRNARIEAGRAPRTGLPALQQVQRDAAEARRSWANASPELDVKFAALVADANEALEKVGAQP